MSEWTPQTDEPPMTLAAIRWYALSLERLATALYVTDRSRYAEVRQILAKALTDLAALRAQSAPQPVTMTMTAASGDGGDDACPPGFVRCDGVCLPQCDY